MTTLGPKADNSLTPMKWFQMPIKPLTTGGHAG